MLRHIKKELQALLIPNTLILLNWLFGMIIKFK